jgi:hypothetical protein
VLLTVCKYTQAMLTMVSCTAVAHVLHGARQRVQKQPKVYGRSFMPLTYEQRLTCCASLRLELQIAVRRTLCVVWPKAATKDSRGFYVSS